MTDLGDMLGLMAALAVRPVFPCRNPLCRRPVYADRAVYGYGEDCAEQFGLVVHRTRVGSDPQTGPDLFDAAAAAALEATLTAGTVPA